MHDLQSWSEPGQKTNNFDMVTCFVKSRNHVAFAIKGWGFGKRRTGRTIPVGVRHSYCLSTVHYDLAIWYWYCRFTQVVWKIETSPVDFRHIESPSPSLRNISIQCVSLSGHHLDSRTHGQCSATRHRKHRSRWWLVMFRGCCYVNCITLFFLSDSDPFCLSGTFWYSGLFFWGGMYASEGMHASVVGAVHAAILVTLRVHKRCDESDTDWLRDGPNG